jgi:hypothetical protein
MAAPARSCHILLTLVAVGLPAVSWAGSQPVPAGPEIVVNTATNGDQFAPAVASSADGHFVAVWEGPDAQSDGIWARAFDDSGLPTTSEFLVNQTTAGGQRSPSVATTDDGRFAIAWEGDDASGLGVYLRVFAANGAPTSGEISVNLVTLGDQRQPAVTINEAGTVLVVWETDTLSAQGINLAGRLFSVANGSPLSPTEIPINATTADDQTSPAVAQLDDTGVFIVAWESTDGHGEGIWTRRFSAAGTPLQASDTAVNSTLSGDQEEPSIAATGINNDPTDRNMVVIVWQGLDAQAHGIYAQRFDDDTGAPFGGEDIVTFSQDGDQHDPRVTIDDGIPFGIPDFVATWIESPVVVPITGAPILVRGRRLGGPGRGSGLPEFTVNTSDSDHGFPFVACESNGDFVVAWQSVGQDGSGQTILARRFQVQTIFADGFETGASNLWGGSIQ